MTGVTLVLPFGARGTPISEGTRDYEPDAYRLDIADPNSAWVVDLPPHVAARLENNAGFYRMSISEPKLAGTARLYPPPGVTSCSVGGETYGIDKDGAVVVPSEHAAGLVESFKYRPHPLPEPAAEDDELALCQSALAEVGETLELTRQAYEGLQSRIAELEAMLPPTETHEKPARKPKT